MDNSGVYIIGLPEGPNKVGYTCHLQNRFSQIRNGSPVELSILGLWPTSDMQKAFAVEQAAHAILADNWTRGEWFSVPLAEAKDAVASAWALVGEHETTYRRIPSNIGMWLHVASALGFTVSQARDLANERRRIALHRAKAAGRPGGRPPKFTDEEYLAAARMGWAAGARHLGVSVAGLMKAAARINQRCRDPQGVASRHGAGC